MIRILSFKKTSENNRLTIFKMPLFNKNLNKLTFTSISIKFLNLYLYNQFILVSHGPSNSTIKLRIADFKLFHKNICNLVDIQERFTRSLNSWMWDFYFTTDCYTHCKFLASQKKVTRVGVIPYFHPHLRLSIFRYESIALSFLILTLSLKSHKSEI